MDFAFISPPKRIPFFLRLGIWYAGRVTGRDLLPARLLAWYPRAAVGSGILEALVAHSEGRLNQRMLKLVRVAASLAAACPFCIDMNSYGAEQAGVLPEELDALRARQEVEQIPTLSPLERLAVRYARLISQTPLKFPADFVTELTAAFKEKEIVILASTAAQVNYWARLIQALGVPPAGFNP